MTESVIMPSIQLLFDTSTSIQVLLANISGVPHYVVGESEISYTAT